MFSNKALWKLMAPLAFDQLLNSMMGTVGTMVVSNLGSAAISAVSLVDAINVLIVQAFYALAAGGTVVCSQYLGCKKEKEANEAARQLLFITFVLSVVIAAICLAANGPLLRLIFGEVEPQVMKYSRQYFIISAISYPFIALYDDDFTVCKYSESHIKYTVCMGISYGSYRFGNSDHVVACIFDDCSAVSSAPSGTYYPPEGVS